MLSIHNQLFCVLCNSKFQFFELFIIINFLAISIHFLHVKMGETTAASSHESNTGIDGLDPNNVEGNEAVIILI